MLGLDITSPTFLQGAKRDLQELQEPVTMFVLLTEVYRHTTLHGAIAPRELVPVLVLGRVVEIVCQNVVQVQVHPHLINDNKIINALHWHLNFLYIT